MEKLDAREIKRIKTYYAERWIDPVLRIEDTFNIRRSDGSLVKMQVPDPQKEMIRDGILWRSKSLVGTGVSYIGVTNKGRQLGFSAILGAENILIAEDYSNTFIYYVATAKDQAEDWMKKVNQLIEDSNSWPEELGGGKILTINSIKKVFDKEINGTHIVGMAANPSAIRGKTGIVVVFDEAAWAIRFKNQARETWKALKYIIRQGGQARIQSTPRTSDTEEFFWGIYSKGESGNMAIHHYECPVITNWKELDLSEPLYIDLNNARRKVLGMKDLNEEDVKKLVARYENNPIFEIHLGDCIKQKAEIPYWWVNLADLETDRAEDLEQFKQENLCVPLDETYKLIKSEWIYGNLNEDDEWNDRRDSKNRFFILMDFAQKNDLTAITVVEELPNINQPAHPFYVERKIVETNAKYDEQKDIIFDLIFAFRPDIVSGDNTGHGIPLMDDIERHLRDNGFNVNILKRVTFTQQNKEQMAQGFRNIVMPDNVNLEEGKSHYRWLYKRKHQESAIRHCLRVEKELLPQGGTRYSGKMHGRDDHFWSKAQIALYRNVSGIVKAAFGRYNSAKSVVNKTIGMKFIEENDKKGFLNYEGILMNAEEAKYRQVKIKHENNLKFAFNCLMNGMVKCRTANQMVKPIHCADDNNCCDGLCEGYAVVKEMCIRYEVSRDELRDRYEKLRNRIDV